MLKIDLRYQWHTENTQSEEVFDAHYQTKLAPGITVLLGASGEGKSTLLHLLGGFIRGRGSIRFLDNELSHLTPEQRPITTLFQNDNLFPQLDVWQNVAIGLAPNLRLKKEENDAVEWALERTKVSFYRKKKPETLSGGQLQRVALARAVARAAVDQIEKKRPILLLDEPFSALDPSLRMSMLELVSDLTKQLNLTTLLVSHLPNEIKQVNGELLLIDKGRIVLQAKTNVLHQAQLPDTLRDYLSL